MTIGVIDRQAVIPGCTQPLHFGKIWRTAVPLLCILLFLFTFAGCRVPWSTSPAVLESGLSPAEMKQYFDAVSTYQAGNFQDAAIQFAAIREQTANPTAARMALYGLACARIMTASTPKEYREALALWDTWLQCARTRHDRENPILLGPIIRDKMVFSHIPLHDGETVQDQSDQENYRWFMFRANGELQRLKSRLERARQDIDDKNEKIEVLEKEIDRLKKQINAFEKIDQKIQKKKNAIPINE